MEPFRPKAEYRTIRGELVNLDDIIDTRLENGVYVPTGRHDKGIAKCATRILPSPKMPEALEKRPLILKPKDFSSMRNMVRYRESGVEKEVKNSIIDLFA